MGQELAKEAPAVADIVISVPDSGTLLQLVIPWNQKFRMLKALLRIDILVELSSSQVSV